jgi:hypothetical protein
VFCEFDECVFGFGLFFGLDCLSFMQNVVYRLFLAIFTRWCKIDVSFLVNKILFMCFQT